MAKSRRKKKVKIQGVLRLAAILGIFGFAVYMLIVGNFGKADLTYTLEYDTVHVKDTYKTILIRKELLLKSANTGTVLQVANDGERVKRDQRIMEITKTEDTKQEALTFEAKADSAIELVDLEQLDLEIKTLKTEIAGLIQAKSYDMIHLLSDDLDSKIKRKKMMIEGVSEETYDEIELGDPMVVGETQKLNTPTSGILTYFIDGYEADLTYANMRQIDLETMFNSQFETYQNAGGLVKQGETLGKIIDDDYYYMIFLVEKGEQNYFDLSQDVVLEVGSEKVDGFIFDVFPTQNKAAIVIKVESYIKDFHKFRFVDVSITQDTHKGLIVKSSSLVYSENGVGVHVVDKYNEVSFVPIKVIAEYGDTVIVKEDAFYEFIDGSNTMVETVGVSDKVLVEGMKYQPGDVID